MLYIKIEDGQPVGFPITEPTLRQILSNVSLPYDLDPEELLNLGYAPYEKVLPPDTQRFEKIIELTPTFDGTKAIQNLQVEEMSEQEKDAVIEQQLAESRSKQQELLAATDWTELPSVRAKNTEEWAAAYDLYRTELRDTDKQDSWPFDVIWPKPPYPMIVEGESV
jgi:hypothetical protein